MITIGTGALEHFLTSPAGERVTKIYIQGQDVAFEENCITRNGSAEGIQFYVDSLQNKRDLREALNVTTIASIEELENRIRNMENRMKGVMQLQPDNEGRIGINIPGVLRIDNVPLEEEGTNYNLLLEEHNMDIYRKKNMSVNENGN